MLKKEEWKKRRVGIWGQKMTSAVLGKQQPRGQLFFS
jgi:hypothetical protein